MGDTNDMDGQIIYKIKNNMLTFWKTVITFANIMTVFTQLRIIGQPDKTGIEGIGVGSS